MLMLLVITCWSDGHVCGGWHLAAFSHTIVTGTDSIVHELSINLHQTVDGLEGGIHRTCIQMSVFNTSCSRNNECRGIVVLRLFLALHVLSLGGE